jgi:DNA-binding MarR family transcriptional regulator
MYIVNMKAEQLHQLIWMSRPLMQAAESYVEAGLAGTNLTVRMRAVLEILDKYGEQTVPELAARLEIQRQYVQIMCNETLASGFIEQRANPRHKRSPILALTDHGRTLIEEIISKEMKIMEQMSEHLSGEDIATALRVVLAVADSLKKRTGQRE